jgi:RND family efflux transporter MFP subunit
MNFFKRHKKKIILALILILVLFFGLRQSQAKKRKNPAFFNPQKDIIVTPQLKTIEDTLTLSGSIDAHDKAEVNFQTSGRLAWVGVKEGDRVKKWQSLASLDRQELRKQLEISFNNYQSQLSQFDDTQDKYKQEKEALILTDEMKRILARSQFALDNAVINYELNDLAVKYATIWSPINGIVVSVAQPHPGVNITPANSSFIIVDPASVYFKAEIDEDDLSRVRIGQPATVEIDAFPDDSFDSEITQIAFTPIIGQSSTVYKIDFKLPVDNQDLRFRLGMSGDVKIILKQEDNVLVVPIDALNQEDDNYYLWVKTNNSNLEKKEVTIGIETDEEVQIIQGINPDDQIIIKKK